MSNTTKEASSAATQGAPSTAPAGNGMSQAGSGPAALLYSLSSQLIGLYSQVEATYNQMTMMETDVQEATIKIGADAQRSAADNQAYAIKCQMWASIGSAAIMLAQTGATMWSTRGLNKDSETADLKMKKLTTLDDKACAAGKVRADDVIGRAPAPPEDETVTLRAKELKYPENGYETKVQDARMPNEDLDSLALEKMQREGDLDDFREDLRVEKEIQSRKSNTIASTLQTKTQQFGIVGQIATSACTSVTQGRQAYFTAQAGQDQAEQQVAQGVQQMASGMTESTRQGIGKFYDQIASIIAVARAGAQAYAQT